MKSLNEIELQGINGGYYTNEEVNAMMPESSEIAENIGYAIGRALAFIGVVLITRKIK